MFYAFAFCCLCCCLSTAYLVGVFADTDAVTSVSVLEGDSVTLNSGLTEIMDDDLIQWRFVNKNTLIAQINVMANSVTINDAVLDGRFRNRLKLDHQTGSLTIINTRTEHAGLYQLQTNNVNKNLFLTVYGAHVSCCNTVEAVMRLVVTALMGVAAAAAVALLINDIRSTRG